MKMQLWEKTVEGKLRFCNPPHINLNGGKYESKKFGETLTWMSFSFHFMNIYVKFNLNLLFQNCNLATFC